MPKRDEPLVQTGVLPYLRGHMHIIAMDRATCLDFFLLVQNSDSLEMKKDKKKYGFFFQVK